MPLERSPDKRTPDKDKEEKEVGKEKNTAEERKMRETLTQTREKRHTILQTPCSRRMRSRWNNVRPIVFLFTTI